MSSSKTKDYSALSREELIDKIRKLELHVQQLRNVISKRSDKDNGNCNCSANKRPRIEGDRDPDRDPDLDRVDDYLAVDIDILGGNGRAKSKKINKQRPFDYSSVPMRHVAFKILYLGWDYQGLAVQEDTQDTIEAHLFKSLTLTRLIEDRTKSNYHRCGRTDKGVSAFSQVISIDVRSKVIDGMETLDYCKILNRTLPKDIRVISWSPVRPDFSARFDCCLRTYKYFFPKGDLDIQKMIKAAQPLIGEHDYRNFCKVDKDNNTTMRRIDRIDIIHPSDSPYEICQFVIVGKAYLWHQIRCIFGILLLIGQGLEEEEAIVELLDFKKNPRKPQYSMAIDYPLVLYDVQYPEIENIKWTSTEDNRTALLGDLQMLWMRYSVKGAMIQEMLNDVESVTENKANLHTESLVMGTKRKMYVKLMDRQLCGSDQ